MTVSPDRAGLARDLLDLLARFDADALADVPDQPVRTTYVRQMLYDIRTVATRLAQLTLTASDVERKSVDRAVELVLAAHRNLWPERHAGYWADRPPRHRHLGRQYAADVIDGLSAALGVVRDEPLDKPCIEVRVCADDPRLSLKDLADDEFGDIAVREIAEHMLHSGQPYHQDGHKLPDGYYYEFVVTDPEELRRQLDAAKQRPGEGRSCE